MTWLVMSDDATISFAMVEEVDVLFGINKL